MASRILDSLEIKGFRAFEHLKIAHLGSVNLIVGKNSVGKSSVLEALMFYAKQGHPTVMSDLLESRYEGTRSARTARDERPDIEEILYALRFLFFGRPQLKKELDEFAISIGPTKPQSKKLSIQLQWYDSKGRKDIYLRQQALILWEKDSGEIREIGEIDETYPGVRVKFGKDIFDYPLDRIFSWPVYSVPKPWVKTSYVSASGLSLEEMGNYWDEIALTELQEEVKIASQMIVPGVEDINFVFLNSRTRSRVPVVKLNGSRIPLHSLGEGSVRLLGLALSIVNAKGGMLLVDEIESGLHYSVHSYMWQFVFRLAERLNVQVFATTHSNDCVKGFQYAAKENEQVEGQLIRLERWGDKHTAITLDERQLEISVTQNIETR